jgi:hypothetical protein
MEGLDIRVCLGPATHYKGECFVFNLYFLHIVGVDGECVLSYETRWIVQCLSAYLEGHPDR